MDGLFVMKSIFVYDRIKSLEKVFDVIKACQPLSDKDPELFKGAVTGIIPLDKNDEGFSSIHLNLKIEDVYKYFRKLINEYEVNLVKLLKLNH